MKIRLFFMVLISFISVYGNAQKKKDGTPDLRYKSNKLLQGNSSIPPKSRNNATTHIRFQNGYRKTDGTNVKAHYKTIINNTNTDNFSTRNNYNFSKGTYGKKAKDYSHAALNYGKGKIIQTGNKGGQYYYDNRGKKTYVPKR